MATWPPGKNNDTTPIIQNERGGKNEVFKKYSAISRPFYNPTLSDIKADDFCYPAVTLHFLTNAQNGLSVQKLKYTPRVGENLIAEFIKRLKIVVRKKVS